MSSNNKSGSTSSIGEYDYEDKQKVKNGLPDKLFRRRESVITFLFENPHVKTLHHIAIILFIGLCFITYIRGYIEQNEVASGIRLIYAGFRDIHISLLVWMFIYMLACCVYWAFLTWSRVRGIFGPGSTARKVCDVSSCLFVFGYYVFSFAFVNRVVTIFDLPTGSAAIILVEQTRLLMKVHAFVRSNAPKVLYFKEKSDRELVLPTFGHFIFFTWIPTLVYKDEYPRASKIHWNKVAGYSAEILASICCYSFVLERYLIPQYKDFGLRKFSKSDLFLAYLESIFPSAIFLLVSFYLILHLVQNLVAELSRFGDRMFYKDWWTATDFNTYYRKWNVVVHDWLYTYVFKDCYEILFPGHINVSKYATFFLSAIVHEWIVMNMLGYFLPIMFVQFFGFGTILTYVKFPKNAVFNMLYWLSLAVGSAAMIMAYGLEYYARFNGVSSSAGSLDFYVPRILTCDTCYSN